MSLRTVRRGRVATTLTDRRKPRQSRSTLSRAVVYEGRMSDVSALVEAARAAALRAYAPYSRFSVGCAIESIDGEMVAGANMENACYRLGVCAEIAALTAAQHAFGLDRIARIAVSGGHLVDGKLKGDSAVTSCGGCRQSILEAAQLSGTDVEVISSNGDGTETRVDRISDLIPHGFGPANLKDSG